METPVAASNLAEKLDPASNTPRPVLTSINGGRPESTDPLDQVTFRKTKRQHIREFGVVIASALVIVAAYKLYHRGNLNTILTLSAVGASFALLGIYTPRLMIPVLKGWMRIGAVLEKVTTFVILGGMWCATFVPVGVLFKIIGKTTMTLGFEPDKASYWENCNSTRNDFKLLERQF